jgi:hypothetical protein
MISALRSWIRRRRLERRAARLGLTREQVAALTDAYYPWPPDVPRPGS